MTAAARQCRVALRSTAGLAFAALGLWLSHPAGATAASESVAFGRLTSEQGLSNNWVLAVLRDSQGFLWVGTEDGLNRYDGRPYGVGELTALVERAVR